MVDIGTGAGFPGLILAIVWSDVDAILSEPINKRASFLRLYYNSSWSKAC